MVSLTSTLLIQLVAGATVPLVFIGLFASRLSRHKSFRTAQLKMAFILSFAPLLVVLAVEGLLTGWMALAGVVLIAILALIARERE